MRIPMTLQGASLGRIPELISDLESMGQMVRLPTRGNGLPESGKRETQEIHHGSEEGPVSRLTYWHYTQRDGFFLGRD